MTTPYRVEQERREGRGEITGRVVATQLCRRRGSARGAEVVDLLQALNTGHDGSLATVHANSARDALHRLETLVVQAVPRWPLSAVRQQLGRSIDAVIHTARAAGGRRRVEEIAEVAEPADGGETMPTLRHLVLSGAVVARPTRSRR